MLAWSGLDGAVVGISPHSYMAGMPEPRTRHARENIQQVAEIARGCIQQERFPPGIQEKMTMSKEPKKCAHSSCSCTVPDGEKYCSAACEGAKNVTELSCQCGHAGCRGAALT